MYLVLLLVRQPGRETMKQQFVIAPNQPGRPPPNQKKKTHAPCRTATCVGHFGVLLNGTAVAIILITNVCATASWPGPVGPMSFPPIPGMSSSPNSLMGTTSKSHTKL